MEGAKPGVEIELTSEPGEKSFFERPRGSLLGEEMVKVAEDLTGGRDEVEDER